MHYDREECGRSAEMGCTLCLLMLQNWVPRSESQRLRFTGFDQNPILEGQNFDSLPIYLDGLFGRDLYSGESVVDIQVHAFRGTNRVVVKQ